MTVGDRMHKALLDAERLRVELESFAMESNNPQAQQAFAQMAQQMRSTEQTLKQRVNAIEQQEPQYRVRQQMQQQQGGQ